MSSFMNPTIKNASSYNEAVCWKHGTGAICCDLVNRLQSLHLLVRGELIPEDDHKI
jgi:hypothetical protein